MIAEEYQAHSGSLDPELLVVCSVIALHSCL